MPTVRRVKPTDLLSLNLCNLDTYTENYDLNFYMTYLMKWPALFQCVEEEGARIVAYIMGKLESTPPSTTRLLPRHHHLPWHGHVTILTVSPTHRRQGYATLLTSAFEQSCQAADAYFVDLYVRQSNRAAIDMYQQMGYSVYRRVVGYYSDELGAGSGSGSGSGSPRGRRQGEEGGQDPGEGEDEGGDGGSLARVAATGGVRGGEDAFDMRKPLARDAERRYIRENGRDFRVQPDEVF